MKKIVVTGAGGFLGFHCLPLLIAAGYEVHAISTRNRSSEDPQVIWHCLDIFDSEQVAALFLATRPSHLLHLAWTTRHGSFWHSSDNFEWLKASITILQKFADAGGQRIVFAGTCAEYDWRYGLCSEEITPLKPKSVYGCCKNSLQQLTASFCSQSGLSWAWGRIFFLYGPHENPLRLVPSVIRALLRNKPAPCTSGTQIRDYLYVKDAANAFIKLLDSKFCGPLNIASGIAIPIRNIVDSIANETKRQDLIRLGALPENKQEPYIIIGDNSILVNEIGWNQNYNLTEGINETISYFREILNINHF